MYIWLCRLLLHRTWEIQYDAESFLTDDDHVKVSDGDGHHHQVSYYCRVGVVQLYLNEWRMTHHILEELKCRFFVAVVLIMTTRARTTVEQSVLRSNTAHSVPFQFRERPKRRKSTRKYVSESRATRDPPHNLFSIWRTGHRTHARTHVEVEGRSSSSIISRGKRLAWKFFKRFCLFRKTAFKKEERENLVCR